MKHGDMWRIFHRSAAAKGAQSIKLTKVKAWLDCCEGRRLAEMLAVAHKIEESEDKAGGLYTKEWTWFGDTPLHAAARHGHAALVRYLLLKGADPTLRCNSGGSDPGGTPIDLATHHANSLTKHVQHLFKFYRVPAFWIEVFSFSKIPSE